MTVKKQAKTRSPNKISCPRCNHGVCAPVRVSQGSQVYRCSSCKHDFVIRKL